MKLSKSRPTNRPRSESVKIRESACGLFIVNLPIHLVLWTRVLSAIGFGARPVCGDFRAGAHSLLTLLGAHFILRSNEDFQ